MPSVYRKGGKWWCKLLGLKEPGKWSAIPTPFKCREKPDDWNKDKALSYANYGQTKIDERQRLLGPSGPITVKNYAEQWLEEPSRKALKSWPEMRGHLVNHVLPIIGDMRIADVRPFHIRDLVRALNAKPGIAPKTVINIYGTLRTMFGDAEFTEVIASTPCKRTIALAELPEKVDKDPEWRELATYVRSEVIALLTSTKVPPERRIQYALKALAGLRHGEVAGLRFRMWSKSDQLDRLSIAKTYIDEETKTKVPRRVPVHPELKRMLEAWRLLWPTVYGDEPTPDDYIVPTRNRTPIDPDDAVVAFKVDLHELGLRIEAGEHRDRGGHDLRAWFISTGLEDGASADALYAVTHTKKKDVASLYNRIPWHRLCEAVGCLKIELGADPLPLGTDELPRLTSLRRHYYKRGLTKKQRATPTGFEPVEMIAGDRETSLPPSERPPLATSCDVLRVAMVAGLGTGTDQGEDPGSSGAADG
jgi:integrase